MKLTELLEKITPLPWYLDGANVLSGAQQKPFDDHTVMTNPRSGGKEWAMQGQLSIQYAMHAANVLPDLVKALELTHNFHNRYFTTQSMDEFRAAGYTGSNSAEEMKQWLFDLRTNALTRAQEVKI